MNREIDMGGNVRGRFRAIQKVESRLKMLEGALQHLSATGPELGFSYLLRFAAAVVRRKR
jgi:hypothetical protein